MKNLTHRLVMTSFAASLMFIGAGCPATQKGDVAVPATGANGETDLSSSVGITDNLQEQAYRKQEIDAANAAAPSQDAQQPAQEPVMEQSADSAKPTVPTSFPGVLPASRISGKQVTINTNKGVVVFEVLDKEGPKAASNFIALAESGFYDGLTFHRVESWVVQGGDPTGTGAGGPGYKFEDEPVNLDYKEGIVAMANAGPDTNGSQFFILTRDTGLRPDYTIFGRVTSGMDVVHKITKGDRMTSVVVGAKQ